MHWECCMVASKNSDLFLEVLIIWIICIFISSISNPLLDAYIGGRRKGNRNSHIQVIFFSKLVISDLHQLFCWHKSKGTKEGGFEAVKGVRWRWCSSHRYCPALLQSTPFLPIPGLFHPPLPFCSSHADLLALWHCDSMPDHWHAVSAA